MLIIWQFPVFMITTQIVSKPVYSSQVAPDFIRTHLINTFGAAILAFGLQLRQTPRAYFVKYALRRLPCFGSKSEISSLNLFLR